MKLHSWFFVGLVSFFLASGCKKDKEDTDETPPPQTCRVATVIASGGVESVININYDGSGKIATANRDGRTSNFSYTANGVVILTLDQNRLTTKTTVEFNGEGLVQKVTSLFIDENGSESLDHVDTYEYNEKGEVLKKITKVGNNVPTTIPTPGAMATL